VISFQLYTFTFSDIYDEEGCEAEILASDVTTTVWGHNYELILYCLCVTVIQVQATSEPNIGNHSDDKVTNISSDPAD
jgi:hypothetical protein